MASSVYSHSKKRAKNQNIPRKTPLFFKKQALRKAVKNVFWKAIMGITLHSTYAQNIVYNGHMKKNNFAKIALVLAGALSLASCDLGSFIRILTSLTPIGANIDDDRENREIKLEYETGEGFLAIIIESTTEGPRV